MGRSTTLIENPAIRTYKWKNEKFDKKTKTVTQAAGWYYWDKQSSQNIQLEAPARLIWLESMQSVTGYNQEKKTGIYSNEVPTSADAIAEFGIQPLQVKIGSEVVVEGSWKEKSDLIKGLGGKYCIATYGLMLIDGLYQIVRFLFAGSSRDAWMNIADRKKLLSQAIEITNDFEEIEMKTTDYYQAPILKLVPITDEEMRQADLRSSAVTQYFKFMFSKKNVNEPYEEEITTHEDDV